jgi:hypothetical protein
MLARQIPDPLGTIAHGDLLFGAAPAPLPGFQIDALAKRFGRPYGAGVGGRIGIANSVAFLVPRGLGKHTTQLNFAGVCWRAVGFAFAPLGFFLCYRPASAVHLHIQNRNWLCYDQRQIQLHSFANLTLLSGGNIGSDSLGRALDRLGRYLQPGQDFHLLATMLKGSLLATVACMRRTPGENSPFLLSSSTSAGNWQLWQQSHR